MDIVVRYCTYHHHEPLLHELILAVGYFSVLNIENQVKLTQLNTVSININLHAHVVLIGRFKKNYNFNGFIINNTLQITFAGWIHL